MVFSVGIAGEFGIGVTGKFRWNMQRILEFKVATQKNLHAL